jgi:hypothetical protein
MKIQKPAALLLAFLFSLSLTAQVKLPFTNNDLRNNLEKVLSDFPREMRTLKGEVLTENPQTIEFASLLQFRGAEENTITQYISPKPIYSWQAILLSTETFEEAAKKYKWLYNQLKVMTVTLDGGYSFTLTGRWEEPSESKTFFSSPFHLTPAATNLPKLQIEVGMEYLFPEWKVKLTVYQKEREDRERGATREGR